MSTPYMWNDWKRNISWIRNHEMTSAFVITTPNSVPIARYVTSSRTCDTSRCASSRAATSARAPRCDVAVVMAGPSQQVRKDQPRRDQPAGEEAAHRDERRHLQVGEARDAVP